jgi:hypothetical protein
MLIQIFAPTSNLPLGVNILTSGGLNAGSQVKSTTRWRWRTYDSHWGTRLIHDIPLQRKVYQVVRAIELVLIHHEHAGGSLQR